jgi:hypothetical protein
LRQPSVVFKRGRERQELIVAELLERAQHEWDLLGAPYPVERRRRQRIEPIVALDESQPTPYPSVGPHTTPDAQESRVLARTSRMYGV